jgi:hypothetical protein
LDLRLLVGRPRQGILKSMREKSRELLQGMWEVFARQTIARYARSTCKINYRKVCKKYLQDKLSQGMQEVLAR